MEPADRELLTGMGNCYDACHASFDETIQMVAGNRGRSAQDVVDTLRRLRLRYGGDPEYQRLRTRFPSSFPV